MSGSAPIASGILLVDKEAEWTSHDVVARTRRLAGTRKVGHAGTLDPMATGLLVLGIGSSTRLLTYLVGATKQYTATIRLGERTSTDDADGERAGLAAPGAVEALEEGAIARAVAALTGELQQVPSSVSAIKVDGKRAYARVRAGEDVTLAARAVTVSRFDVSTSRLVEQHGETFRDLEVVVDCSSGTYIRALARDLGDSLQVGGHLTALRRTRVGPFEVSEAEPLERVERAGVAQRSVEQRLITAADAATRLFPALHLSAQQATDLGHGKTIRVDPGSRDVDDAAGPVAALAPSGELVGLIEVRRATGRSLVVFPRDEQEPGIR